MNMLAGLAMSRLYVASRSSIDHMRKQVEAGRSNQRTKSSFSSSAPDLVLDNTKVNCAFGRGISV